MAMNLNCSIFSLVMLFFTVGCNSKKVQEYKLSGNALGTTYHITYIGSEISGMDEKVDSLIGVINHALSTYQEKSFISHFNNNQLQDWQKEVGFESFYNDLAHFTTMLDLSKEISLDTEGAFDPSAALLFDEYLWAKKNKTFLRDSVVEKCLESQGLKKVESHNELIKLDSNLQLNFNAIAKGYLVDVVADYLLSKSVSKFMVEIGGEMRVAGKNKQDQPWRIGINRPEEGISNTDFFKVIQLENRALATSGNYQNYYYINDSLIGHTIDPRTGKPIINSMKSVSVFHERCAVADAYATAFMVLGYEKTKEIVERNPKLSAYIILEENGKLNDYTLD